MDKRWSDVGLSGVKVEHCGEDHHESNRRPLNNRGPRRRLQLDDHHKHRTEPCTS